MRIGKENSFLSLVVLQIRSQISQKINSYCMQAWVWEEKPILKEVQTLSLCGRFLAFYFKA